MERSTEEAGQAGIQVIARAADILRALRLAPAGLSQAEVADQVGLLHHPPAAERPRG